MYKMAAEREAGFFEQVVLPMLKQRNPAGPPQALDTLDELAQARPRGCGRRMLRQALQQYTGRLLQLAGAGSSSTADELQRGRRRGSGGELSADLPRRRVLVGVLKGSVPFLADLVRRASTVPVEVDFLAISPTREGTGPGAARQGPRHRHRRPRRRAGRGHRRHRASPLTYLLGELRSARARVARGVRAARQGGAGGSCRRPFDFVGFEIPDEFVLGLRARLRRAVPQPRPRSSRAIWTALRERPRTRMSQRAVSAG